MRKMKIEKKNEKKNGKKALSLSCGVIYYGVVVDVFALSPSSIPRAVLCSLFLMDALTFIVSGFLVSVRYSSLGQIVWAHLEFHPVPGEQLDVVHPHFSGNMGGNHMPVFQFNPKHGIG